MSIRAVLAPLLIVLSLAVALVGCGTSSTTEPSSVPPVTVTVTAPPSSSAPSTSESATPRTTALTTGFTRAQASAGQPVGVVVVPVGGGEAVELGDQTPRVAWSTIKVPLAIAAQRANGQSSAQTTAIINSDNASAEQLWSSLGSAGQASAAVTAVLRDGGDTSTVVPAQRLRPGYTVFGQTVWTLAAAGTFTAQLPCMRGTEHVVSLMGQVAANQQWGVETMATPKATAVKGGWGPGASSGYVVRQIGLITYRDGRMASIVMSTAGSSLDSGIAALNVIGRWLNRNLVQLPRGRCS
ncbi:hypothetical protein [Gordonia soli]|uniref:Uncharacterized protein n=1 Tax=Gordonia soli NBRC 108243 TaxID=1223545 RepID=M0QJ09_9ACTN|nr:hypothetical protein [Gordonia soli]GAC68548.1 hypothetical protein GS4_16_00780 [Gordonia soli NBRC 108243]